MYRTFRTTAIASLAIAAGLLGASQSASAVIRGRNNVQNGTGACQAALPNYEGQIRKRPLAIQNEGTALAYVSCSFVGTTTGDGGTQSIGRVSIYLSNGNASPVAVTCTMVDGFNFSGTQTYFPKTQTVPSNSANYLYTWSAASDNGGVAFDSTVNVSCGLPPGMGITITYVYFDEDVGL